MRLHQHPRALRGTMGSRPFMREQRLSTGSPHNIPAGTSSAIERPVPVTGCAICRNRRIVRKIETREESLEEAKDRRAARDQREARTSSPQVGVAQRVQRDHRPKTVPHEDYVGAWRNLRLNAAAQALLDKTTVLGVADVIEDIASELDRRADQTQK